MGTALLKQNFQDWLTQQWVILFGEKINAKQREWLLGPFGETNGIGEKFIQQLAEKELHHNRYNIFPKHSKVHHIKKVCKQ